MCRLLSGPHPRFRRTFCFDMKEKEEDGQRMELKPSVHTVRKYTCSYEYHYSQTQGSRST